MKNIGLNWKTLSWVPSDILYSILCVNMHRWSSLCRSSRHDATKVLCRSQAKGNGGAQESPMPISGVSAETPLPSPKEASERIRQRALTILPEAASRRLPFSIGCSFTGRESLV